MSLGRDGPLSVGIPYDDVSVRADGYDALLRVDIEYLGSVGAGHGDESGWIHEPGVHALFPDDRHAILDTVDAVGNLRKVVLAQGLLVRVEGAVVASRDLESITGQNCKKFISFVMQKERLKKNIFH